MNGAYNLNLGKMKIPAHGLSRTNESPVRMGVKGQGGLWERGTVSEGKERVGSRNVEMLQTNAGPLIILRRVSLCIKGQPPLPPCQITNGHAGLDQKREDRGVCHLHGRVSVSFAQCANTSTFDDAWCMAGAPRYVSSEWLSEWENLSSPRENTTPWKAASVCDWQTEASHAFVRASFLSGAIFQFFF